MAESTQFFIGRENITDALHPTGHCTCQHEGKCDWCEKHCFDCGGTKDQHPVTEEDIIETFGAKDDTLVHEFNSMKMDIAVEPAEENN